MISEAADRRIDFGRAERVICVGQVIGTFDLGGAQRLAYNLAVGLAEMGLRSFAIATRSAGLFAQSPPPAVGVVELKAKRDSAITMLRGACRLRSLIRRERIDLLHVHGLNCLTFTVLSTRAMRRRPSIVFTWQDSESVLTQTGWRRRLIIWALRKCASVSGSSRAVAVKLVKGAGLSNVSVFHGGVPVTACQDSLLKALPRPLVIVWLGRLVPPKDPQTLIYAAARLKAEGLQFQVYVIGAPESSTHGYQVETRALIERLGLSDVVHMLGYVPDEQLKELMLSASIGVQTSHTEGLSIALMEQMMRGLAIVATDVGDTSVALQDGGCGLLIPPKNVDRLAGGLRQVLTDSELREHLGRAARQRALECYSWQRMAERAAAQYHQITEAT